MSEIILYGRPGWGSVIVEAQLVLLGLAHRFEDVGDLFKSAAARDALAKVNPIAQVPTLVLADGTVMTESAAITLHLADITGRDDCVPRPDAPERARFLRWLIFLVANVYPTFTYADDPARLRRARSGARELPRQCRRLRQAPLRHRRGRGRRAVVPGRAVLRARHLFRGADPLATAPGVVRRRGSAVGRDRRARA